MNPFSLSFGKEPVNSISREKQKNEILEGFTSENPEFQVCMLTGVRGSGKTVMMTEISAEIKKDKKWIVTEISPERDMLNALAAELSNRKDLFQIFKDAKINLSFFGFGIEIDSEPPITDIVVALDRMLDQLTRRGKKVLVTLDEAVSNQHVREFASQFQIYMRRNYNLFLLMTGLYENIYELQNEKTLTFLYRAPKFEMEPLNFRLVTKQYEKALGIPEKEAAEMANIVKGYPYAFQVLGYLCFKKKASYVNVIDDFDAYLGEYVYDKIWSELSENDRETIIALAKSETGKTGDVSELADMNSGKMSVYRDRLIKKGLVKSETYGYMELTLPRFKEYALHKSGQL